MNEYSHVVTVESVIVVNTKSTAHGGYPLDLGSGDLLLFNRCGFTVLDIGRAGQRCHVQ